MGCVGLRVKSGGKEEVVQKLGFGIPKERSRIEDIAKMVG
jgi:hypothetical protein